MRTEVPAASVIGLEQLDATQVALAGGKGAQLGELTRIDGIRVPRGFCVTANAFAQVAEALDGELDQLARLGADDHEALRTLGAQIRARLAQAAPPDGLAEAIAGAVGDGAYAVRSSATAEDLPGASFAGQHDSYLGVTGAGAVLEHVRRCWASLFTERAIAYRARAGFDHRRVRMAVVVQELVDADAAGVLFTADPVSGNRTVTAVEAVRGLGDALVSGQVTPDTYEVRDGAVVSAAADPVLDDAQVLQLAELGRRLEAHFGCPQDVEWCLDGDGFAVVQSRPITTLFPVPDVGDGGRHVFISAGHQQMMTDPMKPLGLSLFQLLAGPPMYEAAGRLFVDVAPRLTSEAGRAGVLELFQLNDPLIGDALRTVVERDFVPLVPARGGDAGPAPVVAPAPASLDADPALVTALVEEREASLMTLVRTIQAQSGPALFDFILADVAELKRLVFAPGSHAIVMAGMEAAWWLNARLEEWLGERNVADVLTQSVPHNVTSEMGLALLDVADVIREHPAVVAFLEQVEGDEFLDELATLPGGWAASDAIQAYLEDYGMRCVGEIDVTRPRWAEQPSALVPAILANVRGFAPGEAERRLERGRREAAATERDVLERLRALPDGEAKAAETKRMIDRVRTFAGFREYPKYVIVGRMFAYKRALLREVDRLVRCGVLAEAEDAFFLTFQELAEVARGGAVDAALVARRREAFAASHALTPPRVMTSDGEMVAGAYRRDDAPDGALLGLPVSAGTVEGRARVILDLADADVEPGDILVTAFTDPSWSPLFVAVSGLVTEVGGLMTHGAVIAREYGLPAVVGVEGATGLIADGDRIRVHGTEGYVEVLARAA